MSGMRITIWNLAGSIAFATLLAEPTFGQGGDVDVVVPCVESPAIVPMCYGQHADCAIDSAADFDFFRFQGDLGDVVRVSAAGTSGFLDPRIEVRDAANMTVFGPSNCNGGCCGTCIVAGDFMLPATGLFTIIVNDDGNTETGNYTLHIERMLPTYTIHSLVYSAPAHMVSIGHAGDHDFVSFEGEVGSNVLLSVNGANGFFIDPRVELFDPTGMPLASNPTAFCDGGCCGTCNFIVNIASLPLDGTYTVAVTDNGRTETGNIDLSIQCFFAPSGSCPNSTVVDGPVGASYCTSVPNSTGTAATMAAYGTSSITENRLWLLGNNLPVGQTGIFFAGQNQLLPPVGMGSGWRCIASPLFRFPVSLTCSPGSVVRKLDLGNLPGTMSVVSGQTMNFQFWFRDGASTTNTTDGLAVTFTP